MERFGNYEVVDEIARGGMGVVYRARDTVGGREVALKVLLASRDERTQRRFQREAAALGQLRHPGIVAVFDADHVGDRFYIAMELVEGGSLEDRLEAKGPLPVREAVHSVIQLARAVAHAHAHNVLHRDIKPANVLLAADGSIRLGDFGLTREVDSSLDQTQLTKQGHHLGTPGYWAPEQAYGDVERFGTWTDVYGLGGVLYAALTGFPPQEGESLLELLASIREPPALASALRFEVDPALDAICLRARAIDPQDRILTADALVEALSGWLAGSEGSEREASKTPLRLAAGLGVVACMIALVAVARSGGSSPAAASASVSPSVAPTHSPIALSEPPPSSPSPVNSDEVTAEVTALIDQAGALARGELGPQRARPVLELALARAGDDRGLLRQAGLKAARIRVWDLAEQVLRRLAESEDDAEACWGLGLVLSQRGERVAASGAMREATRIEPGVHRWWTSLGWALSDGGDWAQSIVAFHQAIRLGAGAEAELGLAHALLLSGALAEANSRLDALVRVSRSPEALMLLRVARQATGDRSRSAELRARMAQDAPGLAGLWRATRSRRPRGERDVKHLLSRYWFWFGWVRVRERELSDAHLTLSRSIWLDEESLAVALRGGVRMAIGDSEGARSDLLRGASLVPADHVLRADLERQLRAIGEQVPTPADARSEVEVLFARGRELVGSDSNAAGRAFLRVLERDPEHVGALLGAAESHLNLGSPEKSLPYLARVFALEPDHVDALSLRAWARIETNDLESGLADLKRALVLDRGHVRSRSLRGLVNLNRGAISVAREDLEFAVAADPDRPATLLGRSFAAQLEGDLVIAVEGFERLAVASPRNEIYLLNLALARLQAKDAVGVREAADRLALLSPGGFEARGLRAQSWLIEGKLEKSLAELYSVEGGSPDPRILLLLGMCRELGGRQELAAEAYDRVAAADSARASYFESLRTRSDRWLADPARGLSLFWVMVAANDPEPPSAMRSCSLALAYDPESALAWVERAKVWFRLNQSDRVREDLKRACELDPGDPETWRDIADGYDQLGDEPRASEARGRADSLSRRD